MPRLTLDSIRKWSSQKTALGQYLLPVVIYTTKSSKEDINVTLLKQPVPTPVFLTHYSPILKVNKNAHKQFDLKEKKEEIALNNVPLIFCSVA